MHTPCRTTPLVSKRPPEPESGKANLQHCSAPLSCQQKEITGGEPGGTKPKPRLILMECPKCWAEQLLLHVGCSRGSTGDAGRGQQRWNYRFSALPPWAAAHRRSWGEPGHQIYQKSSQRQPFLPLELESLIICSQPVPSAPTQWNHFGVTQKWHCGTVTHQEHSFLIRKRRISLYPGFCDGLRHSYGKPRCLHQHWPSFFLPHKEDKKNQVFI